MLADLEAVTKRWNDTEKRAKQGDKKWRQPLVFFNACAPPWKAAGAILGPHRRRTSLHQ